MWPGAELNLFLFFSVTVLAVAEHLSMVWFRYIWITQRLVQFLPAQSSDKGKYRFLSIGEMIKAHHHLLQFQLLDTKEPENIDCPWYEPALSVWSLSLYKKFLKDIIAARWQLLSLFPGGKQTLARSYAHGQLSFCYCAPEVTSQLKTEQGSQFYKAPTQNITHILKSTAFKRPDLSNFLQ